MKIRIAILWALVFSAFVAHADSPAYRKLHANFAAIEAKGYAEAKAYQFTLSCVNKDLLVNSRCTLSVMIYGECKDASPLKGEAMDVWQWDFSTEGGASGREPLDIRFLSNNSVELKFQVQGSTYDDFKVAITFSGDKNVPYVNVSSVSGTVLKKRPTSNEERLIELVGVKAPGVKLKRSCALRLDTL